MARVDRAEAPECKTQATVGVQAERHVTTVARKAISFWIYNLDILCFTVSVGKVLSEING